MLIINLEDFAMARIKYYTYSSEPVDEERLLDVFFSWRHILFSTEPHLSEDVHLLFRAYEKYSQICDYKVKEW